MTSQSQFEVDNQTILKQIADSLNTLANCAQADERRKREAEERRNAPLYSPELAAVVAKQVFGMDPEMKPGFEGAAMAGAINSDEDLELWKKVPPAGLEAAEATKFQDSSSEFGDYNDLEGHAEWKLAVTRDETILGYTHWRTFKESDDPNNV